LERRHGSRKRESLDDLIAQIKRELPNGDKKTNLARISRFPLGIQSGWAIDRDHSDEKMQVEADPSAAGPSGSAALKLSVGDSMRTEVAPFEVPWPFIPHTASAYLRGKGHLTIALLADGKRIGSAEV